MADYERGLTNDIMPYAWQSETCIGDWHYKRALYDKPGEYGGYLPPRDVIHWMIDTVSKNGTFILNIPGKPDGTIDSKEIAVARSALPHGCRSTAKPSMRRGRGRSMAKDPTRSRAARSRATASASLAPKDIRFTRNKANTVVYAIVLGWPAGEFVVQSLGTSSATQPGKIAHVQLVGTEEKVAWKQAADGLHVELPKAYKPQWISPPR